MAYDTTEAVAKFLSGFQMGIEEKAAECKEAATVLANGNAL